MSRPTPALALAAAVLAAGPAAAQDLGLRETLVRRGLTLAATAQLDPSVNVLGGRRRGVALRQPLGLGLDLDGERLVGWRGARLHVAFQAHAGDHGTEALVGDAQGFDNLDAERFRQLSELWLEQSLAAGRLRVKLGKVDANTEFARVEHGGEFLNSSAGFSPTIQGFPTYPDPATSVSVLFAPTSWVYAGAGFYDGATHDACHGRTGNRGPSTFWGAPSSVFQVGEVGFRWRWAGRAGHAGAGAWRHTGRFARADGGTERGTSGAYAVLEQVLWREGGDGDQGLAAFTQWGRADRAVAEIDRHLSLGAVWTGALPQRDGDVLGLMVSTVRLSPAFAAGNLGGHETAFELFYGLAVAPWLTVKPDVQYILDPGAAPAPHALVGTLRVTFAF